MGALVRCKHQPPAYKPIKSALHPRTDPNRNTAANAARRSTAQKKPAQGGLKPCQTLKDFTTPPPEAAGRAWSPQRSDKALRTL
jgi:hypothetical protein